MWVAACHSGVTLNFCQEWQAAKRAAPLKGGWVFGGFQKGKGQAALACVFERCGAFQFYDQWKCGRNCDDVYCGGAALFVWRVCREKTVLAYNSIGSLRGEVAICVGLMWLDSCQGGLWEVLSGHSSIGERCVRKLQ